jgi:hypothetical protein
VTIVNVINEVRLVRGKALLLGCAATVLAAGCASRVYSEPGQVYPPVSDDAVVYVNAVPTNIELYPHYAYGDGYAYDVDGRWYQRGPRGWGYYRREPLELQRMRVQRAPAAAREREYVQRAPEAARERPAVQQAPVVRRLQPGAAEMQPRRQDSRPVRPTEERVQPHEERK